MLSDILKTLRMEKGLLQKELAEQLGIEPDAYRLYESGKRNPKYDTLLKIADFYNVSTDYLLRGIETNQLQAHADLHLSSKAIQRLEENKPVYFSPSHRTGCHTVELINALLEWDEKDYDVLLAHYKELAVIGEVSCLLAVNNAVGNEDEDKIGDRLNVLRQKSRSDCHEAFDKFLEHVSTLYHTKQIEKIEDALSMDEPLSGTFQCDPADAEKKRAMFNEPITYYNSPERQRR